MRASARRQHGAGVRRASPRWWPYALLATVAYVPLLLTAPGSLNADTKQYLYLAPGRLLSRAPELWDPSVGLGTVTHQNIGYLWPMGPFFWVFDQLVVADWVAQRLWVGTILLAAGAGVLYLLRVLDLRGVAPAGAAFLYMLSPFTLGYVTGASVILLPFAGLPWILAFTVLAVRRGGWRFPAAVALVVTTVGSVNASSLLFAGLAAVLWLPFAVWVTREAPWRRAGAAAFRIGGLTAATQLWWLVALTVGGRYGLPLLRTTETVEQVSGTSSAPEVLRGLGYWFFYGGDNIGSWLGLAEPYMEAPWLLAATFAVPVLGVAAAVALRWRHRAYFATLALLGTVLAVGAHPPDDPSFLGRMFRDAAQESDLTLSLRNTQRAVPLVALAFAVLVAAALSGLHRRVGPPALGVSALVAVVAGVGLAPLWTGEMVADRFHREEIPGYWHEAVAWLDAEDDGTRVLELPGSDFAAYRWGNTLDPVTPGLTDRPVAARELVPFGSPSSASLLNALDRRIQEGQLEPEALASLARLMGAGHVLFRFDLEYERYRTPRPWVLWDALSPTPPGLGDPVPFGAPAPNRAAAGVPMIDEITLATIPGQTDPAPVVVFPVDHVPPLLRVRALGAAVVLAGDGEGVVEAASAGLVDGHRPLFYSGDLAGDEEAVEAVLEGGPLLVLTDTNRRSARRWFTLRENAGSTERAGEEPLVPDPTDARLEPFPAAGDDARTVAVPRGGVWARASAYGNPVSLVPDDRPALAVDGDLLTAWLVGGFAEAIGERIVLELDDPVTTDHVELVQPQRGALNRWITEVRVTVGDGDPFDVQVDDRSRAPEGQPVEFEQATFDRVEIEITGTDLGRRRTFRGVTGVGFAEIRVAGRVADAVERLPVDLFEVVPDHQDHRLAVVLARRRSNPAEPVRTDPEEHLARAFELPGRRSFGVAGTARLSAYAADEVLDRLLGVPRAEDGGVTVRSSGRLPGDLTARASSALDGDPTTRWSPGFLAQRGHWIEVGLSEELTLDRLDLAVVADGRHSVPTELLLETHDGQARVLELPPLDDRSDPGSVASVPVRFEEVRARAIRLTVTDVREVRTRDWYSAAQIEMPVGIAEVGIPGLTVPSPSAPLDTGCRDDLLTVDGSPVAVRITGALGAALARRGLSVEGCAGPLDLAGGTHVVETALGREVGLDLDRLVLTSDAGGEAVDLEGLIALEPGPGTGDGPGARAGPRLVSSDDRRTTVSGRVEGADEPFFLVMAQSHNRGWDLGVAGGRARLGERHVVDGFGNGWLVTPAPGASALDFDLRWRPQALVRAALLASLLAAAACLGLVAVGDRVRWPARPSGRPDAPPSRRRLADQPPEVRWPWEDLSRTRVMRWRGALAGAALASLLAAAAAAAWVGVLAGVLVLWALRSRRPALVLGVPALLAIGVTGSFVVAAQVARAPAPEFAWPEAFSAVHWVAMASVVLLAALPWVELARSVRSAPRAGDDRDAGAGRDGGVPSTREGREPDRL